MVGTVAADGRLNTVSASVVGAGELSLVTRRRSVMVLVLKVPLAPGRIHLQALAPGCSRRSRRCSAERAGTTVNAEPPSLSMKKPWPLSARSMLLLGWC